MDSAAIITALTTMLVIVDPIGLTPMFIALTNGMALKQRRTIAIRACIVGASLLIAFGLFGEALLGFVGISMPAFRIAGGILLFITALDMLFQRRQQRRQSSAEDPDISDDDPSVFPLGIPLIAGPGAITTMILLTDSAGSMTMLGAMFGVMIFVVVLVLAAFLLAPRIEHLLGKTGIDVITRLLGMLLAALAVQFVIDGITATWGLTAGMAGH